MRFDEGGRCTQIWFDEIWPSLMTAERVRYGSGTIEDPYVYRSSLHEASLKTVAKVGTKKPTACTIFTDADLDVDTLGKGPIAQRMIVYNLSEDPNVIDAFGYPEIGIDGIRIDYSARCKNLTKESTKAECSEFQIEDFVVCRSLDSCDRAGISVDVRDARVKLASKKR